jgi:uncharacterized protein
MVREDIAFCGIAVMAKASSPGRTKTRLCPPLTPDEAAECNTAFLKDISANLIAAASVASIAPSMAYGPPGSEAFFRRHLPESVGLYEVWNPDLGLCLKEAMKLQLEAGHAAACVLNSDSPTLPIALLVHTVLLLQQPGDRAVLGPSTDGGYYLLGCKTLHPRLFEDIAWSTEVVAAQTLERAAEIGLPIHVLPHWYDVDDCESIKILMGELLEGRGFSPQLLSSPAPHSRAFLRSMVTSASLWERLNAEVNGFSEAAA